MAAPRPLIVGNWKMNGRRAMAAGLAGELARRAREAGTDLAAEIVLCPPFPLLAAVAEALAGSPIGLGAQDCHAGEDGAHTGDVGAGMLADLGCRYVIVGHSERRAAHGEDDALVAAKAAAAHRAGLAAIVCLGETQSERARGETLAVATRQLGASLPAGAAAGNTVVAYEPVWAIGSGKTPTAAEVAEVHGALRRALGKRGRDGEGVRLLYGGSVKAANAEALLGVPEVDGALVGGASLDAREFWAIAAAGSKVWNRGRKAAT
jgi:triosephosphate isomerase